MPGRAGLSTLLNARPRRLESSLRPTWPCLHSLSLWRWAQGLDQRNQSPLPSKYPQGLCQCPSVGDQKGILFFFSLSNFVTKKSFIGDSSCSLPNDKLVSTSLLESRCGPCPIRSAHTLVRSQACRALCRGSHCSKMLWNGLRIL